DGAVERAMLRGQEIGRRRLGPQRLQHVLLGGAALQVGRQRPELQQAVADGGVHRALSPVSRRNGTQRANSASSFLRNSAVPSGPRRPASARRLAMAGVWMAARKACSSFCLSAAGVPAGTMAL